MPNAEGRTLLSDVAKYYTSGLKNRPDALAYLAHTRHRQRRAIEHFKIGLATERLDFACRLTEPMRQGTCGLEWKLPLRHQEPRHELMRAASRSRSSPRRVSVKSTGVDRQRRIVETETIFICLDPMKASFNSEGPRRIG